MQLNMLNDLAEAMKALDGKKTFVLLLSCHTVPKMDDFVSGWGKRRAYWLLLEPT